MPRMNKKDRIAFIFKAAQVRFTDGTGRSVNSAGNCRYRADKTAECPLRCLVGVFIPDDQYSPGMECRGITGLLMQHQKDVPAWFKEHENLLSALQGIHDVSDNWDRDQISGTWKLSELGRAQFNVLAQAFGVESYPHNVFIG